MGEKAEELPACSGASMMELEKAMFDACAEASGIKTFTYQCDALTPKTALFTACM